MMNIIERLKTKDAMLGLVIGIAIMVLIYFLFIARIAQGAGVCSATALSNICKSAGNEETSFIQPDSYKTIKSDFAGGMIPIYGPDYCAMKFNEKYGKNANFCVVKDVTTVARENPFVTDVECTCWS